MPYIEKEDRKALDPLIDALIDKTVSAAKSQKGSGRLLGLINYACTRFALGSARKLFGRISYAVLASLIGTLVCVIFELYRRVASPYEDKKMEMNGDVKEYEESNKEINGG